MDLSSLFDGYHLRLNKNGVYNSNYEWWPKQTSWHSKLSFIASVFILRILIGGLPLELALKRHGQAINSLILFK